MPKGGRRSIDLLILGRARHGGEGRKKKKKGAWDLRTGVRDRSSFLLRKSGAQGYPEEKKGGGKGEKIGTGEVIYT